MKARRCLINQREVGPHTLSFQNALRSALREDPDVILVGEMRDLETIRLAMSAAETGHLVFGTLHTSSAAKTIDRIIDVFPADEKEMVRAMLSESLRAVISQALLKTKDGAGRVAAHEIMICTPAIRNLIREAKVPQMYSAIQTGQAVGMQTLDQCLATLIRENKITPAEARSKAANKDSSPANQTSGQSGAFNGKRPSHRTDTQPAARHDQQKGIRPVHHDGLPACFQDRRENDPGLQPGPFDASIRRNWPAAS